MDILAELRAIVKKGYLLHGSPKLLDTLTPRQANCGAKREGNKCGVYATSHMETAIVFGLLRPIKKHDYGWDISSCDNRTEVTGRNVVLGSGYVYVLPRESFQVVHSDDGEETDEFCSLVPVAPAARHFIDPPILQYINVEITLHK